LGAFALFAVAPTLVLVTLSDFALGNTIATEIGKAAAGKLRVAHNVETILDDTVKQLGMRITLDPDLKALAAHTSYSRLLTDARTQFEFRRYLELLDDSVRPNSLLKSVEIVFEDADYVLSSVRGVSSWNDYVDAPWLRSVVAQRGFEGSGTFLPPHIPGDSSPEDLVLSYYFPLPPYLTDLRGAVVIHVVEREFSHMVNNSSSEVEGTISVVDTQGVVVSDVRKSRIGQPWDRAGTFYQKDQGEGLLTVSRPDGDHLVTWFRPDRGPWTYVGDFSLAALTQNVGTVRGLTIAISLVLIALGIGLSYVLSNRFFHPVRRLIREVNERLGAEVSPEGRNELGLLSGAFDTLLKRETQLFQDLEAQSRRRDEDWVNRSLRGDSSVQEPSPPAVDGRWRLAGWIVFDHQQDFVRAAPPDQRDYLRSVVLSMAERAFLPEIRCLGTVADPRGLALVLATDLDDGGAFADRVDEGFETLSSEASRILGTTLTLCLGTRRSRPEDLPESWSEAQALVRQRFLAGPAHWFWEENPAVPSVTPYFPLGLERRLVAAIEARDPGALTGGFSELRQTFRTRGDLSFDNVQLILHQLLGAVIRYLVENRFVLSDLFGTGDLHRSLAEAETLAEALDRLEAVCRGALDRPPDAGPGYVPAMLTFIRTHLHRPIGVEDVAGAVGLSYSHARKVFEQAMGESIVDHTNALRVEEARGLLARSSAPLEVVAASVGYSSLQSFHRQFKKGTGLTPGEFRARVHGADFAESSRN